METWKLKGRSLPLVVLLLSWPRQGDIVSLYSCVKWHCPILRFHFTPSRGKPFGDSLVLSARGTHFWSLKSSSLLEDVGVCIWMEVPTTCMYMWTLHSMRHPEYPPPNAVVTAALWLIMLVLRTEQWNSKIKAHLSIGRMYIQPSSYGLDMVWWFLCVFQNMAMLSIERHTYIG